MTSAHSQEPQGPFAERLHDRLESVAPTRRPRALESLGRRIVRDAMSRLRHGRLRVVEGETTSVFGQAEAPAPEVTVRVLDPEFYAAAAFGGSVGIAEAYIDGAWETDDLAGLVELVTRNDEAMEDLEGPMARALGVFSRGVYWLERNTRAGSRRNIVAHYDLGNEFFSLFLDPSMTYSCAIFEPGATSLEDAQREKIDRACRKLALGPDDRLLEIGTGWGALALHAATRYGCRVTTTTISDEQHRLTTARVREAGLHDRVTVLACDYRDLPARFAGSFDKLVSIEMIEAVGQAYLGTFFDVCARCLTPEGTALIQSIVIRDRYFERAASRRDFLKKYIFPGSCLPSVSVMLEALRSHADLEVTHLESIGPHYATTLRMWREAFLGRLDDVRRLGYDERFVRMWEYYLAYCEGAFRAGHVGNVQIVLDKHTRRRRVPAPPGTGGA
ncbi:MAG: cyclopropane-fatty-acyl-phospholipid synthase family protein [Planctomycetota bacterium]|nr:cyclopropane-fatty-acyl-phospholipid synthase family protein [Planctomycetota bacterium]